MTQAAELTRPEQAAVRAHRTTIVPRVDIFEDPQGILLVADLPGVPKEKLDIKIESNRLTIEGEATLPIPEGMKAFHTELRSPVYRRTFALGRELDHAAIEANLKDGVLRLRIPRHAAAQPHRVEVKAG